MIKNNPLVYTTHECNEEIKNNSQIFTTQEGMVDIKNNPQVYTNQGEKKRLKATLRYLVPRRL